MANSADSDQLASSEANWSGSTVCKGRVYPGSAGQGLRYYILFAGNVKPIFWKSAQTLSFFHNQETGKIFWNAIWWYLNLSYHKKMTIYVYFIWNFQDKILKFYLYFWLFW